MDGVEEAVAVAVLVAVAVAVLVAVVVAAAVLVAVAVAVLLGVLVATANWFDCDWLLFAIWKWMVFESLPDGLLAVASSV